MSFPPTRELNTKTRIEMVFQSFPRDAGVEYSRFVVLCQTIWSFPRHAGVESIIRCSRRKVFPASRGS